MMYRRNVYIEMILYCHLCKTNFDEVCRDIGIRDDDKFYRYGNYKPYGWRWTEQSKEA